MSMPTFTQKLTPCLWFDSNCEEAVNFYTGAFPNSQINVIQRYPDDIPEGPMAGMGGKVLTAIFELDGHSFQALDGGPLFTINPSISFMLNFDPAFDDQAREHLDELWAKLSDGGQVFMELGEYPFSSRYGWVQDRFGVSWQLIFTDPEGEPRPKFIPSLLFTGGAHGKAAEAIAFYSDVFPDSQVGMIVNYPPGSEPDTEDTVMFSEASLSGDWVTAMDSARMHGFTFNEAISLSIDCADQAEVDYFWDRLSAVSESEACGWVKDEFGVSWQIVPRQLGELMSDPDPERTGRVMQAFMSMKKFDIAALKAAADGV